MLLSCAALPGKRKKLLYLLPAAAGNMPAGPEGLKQGKRIFPLRSEDVLAGPPKALGNMSHGGYTTEREAR